MDEVESVLPFRATRELERMVVCVATVAARSISSLVRLVTQSLRQPELSHLKRVHRLDRQMCVLLWSGRPERRHGDVGEPLPQPLLASLDSFELQLRALELPKHAPVTREQFELWSAEWPLVFHEAAQAHALALWRQQPSDAELEQMRAHMRSLFELLRRARPRGGGACAGGRHPSGSCALAALIVRPARDGSAAVIAQCCAGRLPDRTAAFGSAAGSSATCAPCEGSGSSVAPCHPNPLTHELMVCIGQVGQQQVSLRAGRSVAAGVDAADPPLAALGTATAMRAGLKRGAEGEEPGQRDPAVPYLCTGCDAYVVVEPCAMCSMALVHSRIRRLVYALPSANRGALGSRYRLHTEPSLNHHFQVFRGLLATEAAALVAQHTS